MKTHWSGSAACGFLIGLLALLPISAQAEQYRQDGDYRIYYNSFPSTMIPGSMTSLYQIERADNRYITNISIHKDGKATRAIVEGFATNLIGQKIPLDFKEIIEKEAVYYLANLVLGSQDTLRFSISIRVEDRPVPLMLEFEQRHEQ